jgi:hypothetical protein
MNFIGDWVAVISATTALIAVVLSPYYSAKIARRQVLSPLREKWISELRDLLAKFMTVILKIDNALESKGGSSEETNDFSKSTFEEWMYIQSKIELLINPNKIDHIELVKFCKIMFNLLSDCEGGIDIIEFRKCRDDMIDISRKILKTEWEEVKKGN